ncbi:MAG: long-chain fatty acid--CoA ligase [bacterium]
MGYRHAARDTPEDTMTLCDLLEQTTKRNPDATALRFRDETVTYAQLDRMAQGFAAGLMKLGVRKGTRIGVLLPNSPSFVVAYIGASRAGVIVVPLNILYRADELRFIMQDAGVALLVTAEPFRPIAVALRPLLPELNNLVMVSDAQVQGDEIDFTDLCGTQPERAVSVRDSSPAVIIYTSGTTGRPKGAVLTHRNLLANSHACAQVLHVNGNDCFITALPLFHAFAALICVVLPIEVGASMYIVERFLPSSMLQTLRDAKATIFIGVPSMFTLMLQLANANMEALASLKLCVSGGSPLSPDVWVAFEESFNTTLVEGYGLTEASPVVAVNPPYGVRKPGSIGLPLPGIQARIVDENNKELKPGTIGELIVRGDNVMQGYLNKPEETRQAIKRGWLYTGDLARMDDDGYLYIEGRKKELIIVGGLNVYPGEVERVLLENPAVLEAVAYGIPDHARGEAVWAAIVLRPEATVDVKVLLASCREKLASYKVPRGIDILPELPKNALGKVMRHMLQRKN